MSLLKALLFSLQLGKALAATASITAVAYTGKCNKVSASINANSTILTTTFSRFAPTITTPGQPSDRSQNCTVTYDVSISEPDYQIIANDEYQALLKGYMVMDDKVRMVVQTRYLWVGDGKTCGNDWDIRGPLNGRFQKWTEGHWDDNWITSSCNPKQLQIFIRTWAVSTGTVVGTPPETLPGEEEWELSTDLKVFKCYKPQ